MCVFKVVVIAGWEDKWTEFAAQQTAAMRGAASWDSWVKTRAALKSQLPTMYTSPPPPRPPHPHPRYLSLTAIQHGTHLSLMAHRDSNRHIPAHIYTHTDAHIHTNICMCVVWLRTQRLPHDVCVCNPLIFPLTLSLLSCYVLLSSLQTHTYTETQTLTQCRTLTHRHTLILF